MRECIFCAIAEGRAPASVVYEDEQTVAFMDTHPAARGHTLVIPRRHFRNVYDIDPKAAAAVTRTTVRVAKAVRAALQPDGMNIFQSNERAAFQSVFHYHVHIVPRWMGDNLLTPPHAKQGVSRAELAELAALFASRLE